MKEHNTKDILKRIEICLAEKGISKERFYSESGISSASYSQWNTGTHNPTARKIKQVADYLGVSFQYLWTGEDQKEKPAPLLGGELRPLEIEIIDIIKEFSEKELEAVKRILLDIKGMNENA